MLISAKMAWVPGKQTSPFYSKRWNLFPLPLFAAGTCDYRTLCALEEKLPLLGWTMLYLIISGLLSVTSSHSYLFQNFIVLCFAYRSMIHSELSFVRNVMFASNFSGLNRSSSFSFRVGGTLYWLCPVSSWGPRPSVYLLMAVVGLCVCALPSAHGPPSTRALPSWILSWKKLSWIFHICCSSKSCGWWKIAPWR